MATKKINKMVSDPSRFGDWDRPNVLLVKMDDPRVQECLEYQKQFHTPKEKLKDWPDDAPDLSNMYFHKKGAKRGK